MFNFFAHSEINLGRAGWLLLFEVFGAAVVGVVLSQFFGLPAEFAMIGAWLVNLAAAWYLAKAARALGNSALLYGLFSALGPPAAVASFAFLHSQDTSAQLVRRRGSADET